MKSVICIPGKWKDRSELVAAIANESAHEYLFAGIVLLHFPTSKACEAEVCERDDRMTNSFRVAGRVNRVSEAFLEEIEGHTTVVYLTVEGGDLESAEALARAGQVLLKAGGIGIKVETAGKAFTKEQWNALVVGEMETNLYKMFVLNAIADEDGSFYSCGMHNLGLKDTIVSGESVSEALALIDIFSYYQLVDKPTIVPGQTFSTAVGATRYRIMEEPNPPYAGHELFGNPFGMWRLQRV